MIKKLAFVCLLVAASLFAIGSATAAGHFLRPAKNSTVIVFVSGFTESAPQTWTSPADVAEDAENTWVTEGEMPGGSWPAMVASNPQYEDIDVYVYDFLTWRGAGSPSVQTIADAMVRDFDPNANRESQSVFGHKRIFFVAHSLGGLVVRTALQRAPDLVARTSGILLFGTPNQGANIANFGHLLFGGNTLWQMQEGRADIDAFLKVMRDAWTKPPLSKIEVRCRAEGTTSPSGLLWIGQFVRVWVVREESAFFLCNDGTETVTGADHYQMVQYGDADGAIGRTLDNDLSAWIGDKAPGLLKTIKPASALLLTCATPGYSEGVLEDVEKHLGFKGVQFSYSKPLPKTWDKSDKSLLWKPGTPSPKLIVLHYSCFREKEGGNSDDLRAQEFEEFLLDLSDVCSSVIVFSRSIRDEARWLTEQFATPVATTMNQSGRLSLISTAGTRAERAEEMSKLPAEIDVALAGSAQCEALNKESPGH